MRRTGSLAIVVTAVTLAIGGTVSAEKAIDPAEVEGTWVREEPTRAGAVRLVKIIVTAKRGSRPPTRRGTSSTLTSRNTRCTAPERREC